MKFSEELNKAKQELLDALPNEHKGKAHKVFALYNKELKQRGKLIDKLSERLRIWTK